MTTAQLIAAPVLRVYDNSGNLAVSGSVYTYVAGTSTPIQTYTDSTANTPNTNPIILNSRGECALWVLPTQSYKLVAYDALGNLLFTSDNMQINGNLLTTVNSISALRAISKLTYTQAIVDGYYTAGDGGGGTYFYNATDTTSADNGGSIIVANDGGRWYLVRSYGEAFSVKQFGAKGDGVTDDTAAINATITATATLGGVVFFPPGSFLITSNLIVPSKVTLKGAGGGENWSTGDGVSWGTSPSWVTRILWGGGYVGASMIALPDATFDAGIEDLYLDGALTLTDITTFQAQFNASIGPQTTLFGINARSNLRLSIKRVTIQNVITGVQFDTAANHVHGFGTVERLAVLTCNFGVRQYGLSTASVANYSFRDCVFIGYYNRGIDFIAWTDSCDYTNIYMSTSIAPTVGVYYNSSIPGSTNGVGFNNFENLIMDLYNPAPGDNGMRSIVCGYTAPGYSTVSGFISPVTNNDPSLFPEIMANGLLTWVTAVAPNYTVANMPLWAGGAKVGSTSSSYAIIDLGALTFFNINHWCSGYTTTALVANFRPASKISRIDWVTYWNPGSASGSIKLVNDGSGAALCTPITPGAAGVIESMQDVTDFLLVLAGGATPNYATPNDFRLGLYTKGDGTTGPTIYTSFLRIVTTDFM